MQTVLEAIKAHPDAFINCASSRACTTPSEHNRALHTQLEQSIRAQDWEAVKIVLREYQPQTMEGLIYALHYTQSTLLSTEITHIVKLYHSGAIE